MYFGGQTSDYKPNQYVKQQHMAHYDHLWAGYENDPIEEMSLKRQQYAEDLKKQIAEKREREQLNKSIQENDQTFSEIMYQNNENKSMFNSTAPVPKSNEPTNYVSKPSNDLSRSMPIPSTVLNTSNNFTETLRAKIDDYRQNNFSSLSQPIQPLSLNQPVPTFAETPSFDSSQFEMPNLSLLFRSNKVKSGRQSQIKPITMIGTSNIRSSLEQTSVQSPLISTESPLNRSKISTPSIGFSMRGVKSNKNKTSFQNSATNPQSFAFSSPPSSLMSDSSLSNQPKYQNFDVSSLANTLQPTRNDDLKLPKPPLLSESQFIYPDGHGSPF